MVLARVLYSLGILSTGTGKYQTPGLPPEWKAKRHGKDSGECLLTSQPRGFFTGVSDRELMAVLFKDNVVFPLISTLPYILPTDGTQIHRKNKKQAQMFNAPLLAVAYNRGMGGSDFPFDNTWDTH